MSIWCVVCRTYIPPTRSQAEHELSTTHLKKLRDPERRVRLGWRPTLSG